MPITINGTGSITGISAGGLPDASITSDDIAAGAVTAAKLAAGAGGKILQVVQTVKTDTYSATSTSTETDITGMSASITPSATSSKILVQVTLNVVVGAEFGGHYIVLKRNGTNVFIGDSEGSRIQGTMALTFDMFNATWGPTIRSFSYLDSPATTSSVTYKLSHADPSGTGNTLYVNRTATTADGSAYVRTASSIILMEVAA